MRWTCATALCVLVAFSSFAQDDNEPADLAKNRKIYVRGLSKIDAKHQEKIKELNKKYLRELVKAKTYYAKKGNLDAALVVDAEIKKFKAAIANGEAVAVKPDPRQPDPIKGTPDRPVRPRDTDRTNGGDPAIGNAKPSMKLGDVYKALALEAKGFSLTDGSISAADVRNDSKPILCSRQCSFNGKCEYSVKVKGRWYHAIMLMVDGKEYSISVGHWANNGTRIMVDGEQVSYKGKEYKVPKNEQEEWREVRIVISGDKANFYYNGTKIHEAAVSIPKSCKLQWGICPYREAIAFKDFSLTLK